MTTTHALNAAPPRPSHPAALPPGSVRRFSRILAAVMAETSPAR